MVSWCSISICRMKLKALEKWQNKKLGFLPKEVKLIWDVILCVPREIVTILIHKCWEMAILKENGISFYEIRVVVYNEKCYVFWNCV